MTKTLSIIGACALTAGIAAAASAQQTTAGQQAPKDRMSKETTITGCLEKTQSGGFWLTKATQGSAGTETTANRPPSSPAASTQAGQSASMTYNLEKGKDLDAHVGHRIEVTGTLEDEHSGDRLQGQAEGRAEKSEMKARDFEVKSVRMISPSCS